MRGILMDLRRSAEALEQLAAYSKRAASALSARADAQLERALEPELARVLAG